MDFLIGVVLVWGIIHLVALAFLVGEISKLVVTLRRISLEIEMLRKRLDKKL